MTTQQNGKDFTTEVAHRLVEAEAALAAIEVLLNGHLDANGDDRASLEMVDAASDAREALEDLRAVLDTMRAQG